MAPTVFGNPITDETLKALPEYANKEITPKDRAQVALSRKLPPPDFPVNVFGYIYNATGHTLNLAYDHDWSGHVDESSPYSQIIENGQWGSFLHVGDHTPGKLSLRQSTAAVVYNANNGLVGGFCKWVLAWDAAVLPHENKAFTMFEEFQIVKEKQNWEALRQKLFNSGHESTDAAYGFKATVSITDGNNPTFHATITLDLPLENA
ncbi:23 kDa jasmonate-induced protein-like [Ziziphus jujuba]|uniref:23 kDa jasmonate-induced protein-like n=1 Tax=Ziziphus jujuba TaxID=326968 RepID=A0ABM3IGX1_ZIZJJ|nr:23 kDa jasmonate-induced protein-like [Ziziphus jujuba]